MKQRYHISPKGQKEPTEAEIAKFRDPKKLIYNYQKAQQLLHRKPIYKDPKAFLVLLVIVLLAYILSERAHDPVKSEVPDMMEQLEPDSDQRHDRSVP
ncbi:MAG: hypothetical protein WAR83_11290 [Flavobacteriales bacterium]|nr:hypothetical protein [Flavobacteriales bacterium]